MSTVTSQPQSQPRLPAPAPALSPARSPQARSLRTWWAGASRPVKLRLLMAALVLLSLGWGALGGWAVAAHSSAASRVAHVDEPLSLAAQDLYQSIADADLTITTVFLSESQANKSGAANAPNPPSTLSQRTQFENDINKAYSDLATLQAGGDPRLTADITTLTDGLSDYHKDVGFGETEYAQGVTPAGDSFMQVASEDAHLTLLPAAARVYQSENAAVAGSSGAATSLPTAILAIGLALIVVVLLVLAQRWLSRRTNRRVNIGMAAATLALLVSGIWLAVAFGSARSDLDTAIGQGAIPAEQVAQAGIKVQQIRGDALLNVLARSGSPALSQDSAAQEKLVWPGKDSPDAVGSLLGMAAAAGNAKAAPFLAAAKPDATAWYQSIAQGYKLGTSFDYTQEQQAVTTGSAPAGYTKLTRDLTGALAEDNATFRAKAIAGAGAFSALEAIIIIAALLMAGASAWGLSRRLAEYR